MKRCLYLSTALVMILASVQAQDVQETSSPALPSPQVADVQNSSGPTAQTLHALLSFVSPGTSRKPLVIVDGVAATNPTPAGNPDLLDTKVTDIQSILVVKDPATLAAYATHYGPDVANGIILISTKQHGKE